MNLRVSFMYLNTARLMITFVSPGKSAFPFTNKSKVTPGIKFKESDSRFLCSVYNLHSKKKCSASSKRSIPITQAQILHWKCPSVQFVFCKYSFLL